MKKSKAITLLSLISFLLVALLVATFLKFSCGVKEYNGILGAVNLDYDLEGGTAYTYSLKKGKDADVNEVEKILKARLDKLGYSNYEIKDSKLNDKDVEDSDITITAKDTESLSSDIQTVFTNGKLKMKAGTSESDLAEVDLEEKEIFDSVDYLGTQSGNNGFYLSIQFSKDAYKIIEDGKQFVSLSIGGQELFKSQLSPESMQNRSYIFGYQNETIARQIYLQLSTGGFEYEYEIKSVEKVQAIYNENAPLIAIIIVATLILLVIIAFSIMFKGFGLVSLYTLLAFILAEVGLLVAIPNINVSLTGVLGIILATLIATDGLILTFNRIKEEFANGKTVKAAVNLGFRRAFKPILNTHVVAVIVSLLAMFLVGGALKSFAITLSIGIVVSFICTALISRLMTTIFIPLVKKPDMFFNFKRKGE